MIKTRISSRSICQFLLLGCYNSLMKFGSERRFIFEIVRRDQSVSVGDTNVLKFGAQSDTQAVLVPDWVTRRKLIHLISCPDSLIPLPGHIQQRPDGAIVVWDDWDGASSRVICVWTNSKSRGSVGKLRAPAGISTDDADQVQNLIIRSPAVTDWAGLLQSCAWNQTKQTNWAHLSLFVSSLVSVLAWQIQLMNGWINEWNYFFQTCIKKLRRSFCSCHRNTATLPLHLGNASSSCSLNELHHINIYFSIHFQYPLVPELRVIRFCWSLNQQSRGEGRLTPWTSG